VPGYHGAEWLKYNGPAIWGGCVTRRQHRHVLFSLARKLSRCKEGMAWFLQIQVQVLSKPGVSRYKFDKWNKSVKMLQMLQMGTCAVSRYKFDRSQKAVMVQDLYYG